MIGCVEAEAGLWVEGEGELRGILFQRSINLPVQESGATPRDAFTYWSLDGNWLKEHNIPSGEMLPGSTYSCLGLLSMLISSGSVL